VARTLLMKYPFDIKNSKPRLVLILVFNNKKGSWSGDQPVQVPREEDGFPDV